jgi:hypothetical protein
MRETTLHRGQGTTNFTKKRRNVNIGVRKVSCPHNFCQDCSNDLELTVGIGGGIWEGWRELICMAGVHPPPPLYRL